MEFHKNQSKDIRKTLVLIITIVSILFMMGTTGEFDKANMIGLTFILGIPLLLVCISFYKRQKLTPLEGIITPNSLQFTYLNHDEEIIMIHQIIEVNLLVSSQRSAVLEILYKDENNKYQKNYLNRLYYDKFVDICLYLERISNDDFKYQVFKVNDEFGKERTVFINESGYLTYLTQKNDVGDKLKEIVFEKKLKRILGFLGIVLLAYLKSDKLLSLRIMMYVLIPCVVVYQLISIVLRIKGYSRKEAIDFIIALFFFLFFGVTSYIVNIVYFIKLL